MGKIWKKFKKAAQAIVDPVGFVAHEIASNTTDKQDTAGWNVVELATSPIGYVVNHGNNGGHDPEPEPVADPAPPPPPASSIIRAQIDDQWFGIQGDGESNYLAGDNDHNLLVAGGDGSDVLVGNADYNNILDGGTGSDHIIGGSISDILGGNFGSDVLVGGGGQDLFVISNPDFTEDFIVDFNAADGDKILLQGLDLSVFSIDPSGEGETPGIRVTYGNGTIFVANASYDDVVNGLQFG
jgi:Ca2+-binding RTX toxin-like protein